MARRLIGLDVGTNAVTVAEVTPGTRRASTCSVRSRCRARRCAKARSPTTRARHRRRRASARRGRPEEGAGARRSRQPACRRAPGRDAGDVARRARRARCSSRPPSSSRSRSTTPCSTSRSSGHGDRAEDGEPRCTCCSPRRTKRRSCAPRRRGRGRRAQVAAVDLIPLALHPRAVGARRRRASEPTRAAAPKASCRSVAASPRSPCTKSASRASSACSAPVAASSPTRSRPSSNSRRRPPRR